MSLATVFSGAGWLRLIDWILEIAPKAFKDQNICDLAFQQTAINLIIVCSGKWAEMPEYDKLILKAGAEKGSFRDMGAYWFTLGSFNACQGKFSQDRELLDDLIFLEEKYGYGPIAPKYTMYTELLVISRLLFEAQNMANVLISFSVKMGQIDDFPGYGEEPSLRY